jgi:hypothetical protein
MNNGMFTAYINWCRISQPATEWEKSTSINGDGSLFSDKTLIFFSSASPVDWVAKTCHQYGYGVLG